MQLRLPLASPRFARRTVQESSGRPEPWFASQGGIRRRGEIWILVDQAYAFRAGKMATGSSLVMIHG